MKKENRKSQFRAKALQRLKKIPNKYFRDKYVVSLLEMYIKKNSINSVMIYIPLINEIDVSPLIQRLRKEKINVYVPFMEGKSFRLVKYRLPLQRKKFGIKEPHNSKQYRKKNIDLAIVPIVGTDATCRRVGFGRGMYDRFFEKEYKNINKVVFVARTLCYSKEIVTDSYDIGADIIITP